MANRRDRMRRFSRKQRPQSHQMGGRHRGMSGPSVGPSKPINAWEKGKGGTGGNDQPMIPCPPFCPDYKPPIYGGEYIEGETGWGGMGGGGGGSCPDGQVYCNLSCTWTNMTPLNWECIWPPGEGNWCVDSNNNWGCAWQIFGDYSSCQQCCQGGCFCESFQVSGGGQYGYSWVPVNGCAYPSQCNGPAGCCNIQSNWNPSGTNNC